MIRKFGFELQAGRFESYDCGLSGGDFKQKAQTFWGGLGCSDEGKEAF